MLTIFSSTSALNALRQTSEPGTPRLPPPRPGDLRATDPQLARAAQTLLDFRQTGISDFNHYWTRGAVRSSMPISTRPIPGGRGQASVYVRYTREYSAAFDRFSAALERLLVQQGTMGESEFGKLEWSTNPGTVTARRNLWVNARLKELRQSAAGADSQVTTLSRAIGTGSWRRRRERGTVGPSDKERAFRTGLDVLEKQLRPQLAARYDAEHRVWVAAEAAKQRHGLMVDTILAAGGSPVQTSAAAPSVPPAILRDGVYTLSRGPYSIRIRRDPAGGSEGPWQWILAREGATWQPVSRPLTDASATLTRDPHREHRQALNDELSRLASSRLSHYVVSRSATSRRGAEPHTVTLHLRFVPASPEHRFTGEWQWGTPGRDGRVPATGWKAVSTRLAVNASLAASDARRTVPEQLNSELLAPLSRRAELPAARLASERVTVARAVGSRLAMERERLVMSYIDGPLGTFHGFTSRTERYGGREAKVWTLRAGGCEAEVWQNTLGRLQWRYRYRVDGAVNNVSVWQSEAALPAETRRFPMGNEPNNGKHPGVEGRTDIHNRLARLQRILRAPTLAALREAEAELSDHRISLLRNGRSYDPGENIVRHIFRATEADPAVYGPGVFRITADGRNLLLRRWAPPAAGGRPANLRAGFGRWQIAIDPGTRKPPPASAWQLITVHPERSDRCPPPRTGWRSLAGLTGATPPPRVAALTQLLGRLDYSEPWFRGRPHPLVVHSYLSTEPGSTARHARSFELGRALLIGCGVTGVSNTTSEATAANPRALPNTASITVALAGAPITPPLRIRMHNGIWQTSLYGADGGGDMWVRAGDPQHGFFVQPTVTQQRYNQIFTLLGQLNDGITRTDLRRAAE